MRGWVHGKINPGKWVLMPILLFVASLFPACTMKDVKPTYESSRMLNNYPSGSTVCYYGGKYVIMGDDAAEVLVLDNDMQELERIEVFPKGKETRLPKDSKADVESSALIDHNGKPAVLFLGSGSHSPHRDSAFILDYEIKQVKRIDFSLFFDELRLEVKDLNIEAAVMLDSNLLLGLRGNTSYPDNYIAMAGFSGLTFKFKRKILIQSSLTNAGISGMEYDKQEDILFITFSSEDTSNSYDDGQIGESYLAFITNAKQALNEEKLVIKDAVALSGLSPEFADQKIESVSLTSDPRRILLVADDDKGNTKIFTLRY